LTLRNIVPKGLALLAALGIAACGSSSSSTTTTGGSSKVSATVNGSGSTLAAPIYQQWGANLKSSGLTINYNAVGSGTGITNLQAAVVQFAGSDPPLKEADKAGMKGPVLQFPVAFGAITVSYNLPGVKGGIKFDGPTLADIFLGKITKWDASQIKALNPGVSLPSTSITVVHRSDSSGTTDGFTTYLSAVSPTWKSQVGAAKDVKWPVGTGAAKNAGVASAIKATTGAIGYVEQAYALLNGFTYAAVKNSSGKFVSPTIDNTSAAARGITVPPDLGITTINSPDPSAYPIVSQTFIDTYKDPCKDGGASSDVAKGLKAFLSYAFEAGQATLGPGSDQLPYAPLTSSLKAKVQAQLQKMVCNGSAIS
jgi:phosphate transport system substrate-binding protein